VKFLKNFFGMKSNSSAEEAKIRLMSVIIHDRTNISPQMLKNLRVDMIELLKKYMDIDESNIAIALNQGSSVELVANVPVLSVKRATDIAASNVPEDGKETQQAELARSGKQRKRR
jgi:cell division topological specificity factor